MASPLPEPDVDLVRDDVARALAEDIGDGDCTAWLIPANRSLATRVVCREDAVLAGRAWFDEAFRQLDTEIAIRWSADEGERLRPDREVCRVQGPARAILTAERTALNFLQTLSGTATRTRRYVDAVAGTGAVVLDTRKTLPGLRRAQKYAVLCGGGANHRIGLFDAVLIKENHIAAAGSITAAQFLQRFIDSDIHWIHVDLAASNHKGGLAHIATDTTGFGVRYTLNLLQQQ